MAWTRKILRVDLSKGQCTVEALNMDWAKAYLGQRGLASKYLSEEVNPTCDALGDQNKLIMATGPLTGSHGINSRALFGHHEKSADGRDRLFKFRRVFRCRIKICRMGYGYL